MSPINFPDDDGLTYQFVSWQEVGEATYELAKKVIAAGVKADRLVVLANGGLTCSRAFADYLGIKKISNIQISFYTGIGSTNSLPVVTQSLSVSIEDEKILVFDDINDSGKTLETAASYLKLRGANSITSATLLQKPHTVHPSDFYHMETDCWMIFPWEIRETVTELTHRWQSHGVSLSEIESRFGKMGLDARQVKYYLDLVFS